MRSSPPAALRASLLALIAGYRRWISPLLPPACRFSPSCSDYASDAVATHGVVRGVVLTARRLARCHPWCEGGLDPVPPADLALRREPARSSRAHLQSEALR
jgi:hypothetical protein